MVSEIVRKLPVYSKITLTLVFPFSILFLDSLRIHDGEESAAPIRDWLNSEWKRLKMGKMGKSKTPSINKLNMPMLTPTGKFRMVIVINFRLHSILITKLIVIHISSSTSKKRMRLWCFRVQVRIQSICNASPTLHLWGHDRAPAIPFVNHEWRCISI
jgi:hypothetical protein